MEKILLKIKNSNIRIKVSDDNLKLDIPKNFNDEALLKDIRKNKKELVDFIKKSKDRKVKFEHIPKSSVKNQYRLTPAQSGIYVLQELAKDSTVYNMPFALEINGSLDIIRLEKVFNNLIKKHESLHTRFSLDKNSTPVQILQKEYTFNIEHVRCEESKLDTVIGAFSKPFDLNKAPLIRASVIEINSNRFILLVDLHHIIFDGFSLNIFIEDLQRMYQGGDLTDELFLQYKDYAEWYFSEKYQNSLLRQKSFWQKELKGFAQKAILPADFQKNENISFEGEHLHFKIGGARAKFIHNLRKEVNVSFFTIFTSLYSIFQSKVTGVNDLVIGTPVAGRRHPDLEKIIGMFVNTIALRLKTKNTTSFIDYVKEVRLKTTSCFENQEYPYEDLIEDLGLRQGNEVNPLFNTLITFNNIEQNPIQNNEFDIKPYNLNIQTSKFDLIMHVNDEEENFNCSFEYKTQLFKRETIGCFFTFICNIIDQVAINNNLPLGDISLLDGASATKLTKLNDFVDIAYPSHITAVQLFENQVQKTPNHVALKVGEDTMTYSELNKRSNQVAKVLRSENVGPDIIVGLLMEKSFELIIGMLGILKAGGAYLPLDVTYPQDRVDYILEDSQVKLVLTSKKHKNILAEKKVSNVYIEDIKKTGNGSNLNLVNTPNDLCYIIYTSGTTGNPKGVMIEHKNLSRLLFNENFQFDFTNQDVWTMFHSHCFDFSVWEMYGALLYGGKLVIVSPLDAGNPSKFVEILRNEKVTVLNQTPSSFYELIEECAEKNIILSDLKYVVFGGEPLTPGKLKSWKKDHSHSKLINMYGITETTVHVTYKEIGENEIENHISNIGRPIPTNATYLLDNNCNVVPEGIIGEIYVGGEGVTRGYLNNEELTKSRFIPNPFRKGEKLYRSGDLGRFLKNGELEYLGRIDRQVQLNGFRIELGEIEYHLGQHELIANAVVVLKQIKSKRACLCAYFTCNVNVVVDDLRTYLGKQLPYYMIPSYFIKLEEIPLSSNNKVDYSKLPDLKANNANVNYVAPVTDKEILVAEIWETVLDAKNVGMQDDFFSLGGDSIKAIKIISTINNQLNTSLAIADIYSSPTIEGLIPLFDINNDKEREELFEETYEDLRFFQETYKKNNVISENFEEVYPMNGIEKGMIFYSLKNQENTTDIGEAVYHEQSLWDLPYKGFDFDLFKQTIKLITDKNAAFRKVYDLENFAHIILKEIDPKIQFIDISNLEKQAQDQFIKEEQNKRRRRNSNMSFSLIWEMLIIKISDSYQYLLFDFHHSMLDGWSLQTFSTDLNNIYLKLVEDKNYLPKPLECSYKDQIFWELCESKKKSNNKYWKEALKDYTRFELPSTGLKDERVLVGLDLGLDYRKKLSEIAKKHNTSIKHLCFAAYMYLLRVYSYSNDIVSGIVTNNRPLVQDSDRLMGCFLNTVPCRINIKEGETWGEYIDFVEAKLRKLKYHERIPLSKILEIIGDKTTDNNPIFDVSFNYVNFWVVDEMQSTGQEIQKNDLDTDKNFMIDNIPFALHVNDYFHSFKFYFYYSTAVFTEEHGSKLSSEIKSILDQFMDNSDGLLGNTNILSDDETWHKKLQKFNNTKDNYPKNNSILDLFKKQVKKIPHNIAAEFEETSLTFKKLDQVSNQLAHKLINMGVKPETLVPISVDRSLEMIIGILAILKAGGAYVPIDPTYPKNRIDYILEDVQSPFILTQSKYKDHFEIPQLFLDNNSIYEKEIKSTPKVEILDTSLAYVIYTSGTTGKPKGVMNTHAGIYNRLVWMQNHFGVTDNDHILQKTNYCFDVSVWELVLPLISGAKLVFAKPEGHKDTDYLEELLVKEDITLVHFVPSMLSIFLSESEKFGGTQLRGVICSGEELKLSTVKEFRRKFSGVCLHNLYGPTEAAIDVTAIELKGHSDDKVSIGRPIANTQIYIVNTENEIQPIGVKGELLIGGVQVARGYLNKPELTSQKFIMNPFDDEDKYKLYKTGDMARWLPDGTIEYLGRMDNQVKLRGNRIELGEIETSLADYDKINTAIVDHREYNNDFCLIGYYITDQSEFIEVEELKAYLKERLPEYMIPSYFIRLEEIPLTSNGKLDKSSLPEPEIGRTEEHVDPSNETEEKLTQIWSDILGVEKENISVNISFFNIGGHSLKAITLVNTILKVFAVNMLLSELFEKQTIKEISDYIITKKQMKVDSEDKEQNVKLLIQK